MNSSFRKILFSFFAIPLFFDYQLVGSNVNNTTLLPLSEESGNSAGSASPDTTTSSEARYNDPNFIRKSELTKKPDQAQIKVTPIESFTLYTSIPNRLNKSESDATTIPTSSKPIQIPTKQHRLVYSEATTTEEMGFKTPPMIPLNQASKLIHVDSDSNSNSNSITEDMGFKTSPSIPQHIASKIIPHTLALKTHKITPLDNFQAKKLIDSSSTTYPEEESSSPDIIYNYGKQSSTEMIIKNSDHFFIIPELAILQFLLQVNALACSNEIDPRDATKIYREMKKKLIWRSIKKNAKNGNITYSLEHFVEEEITANNLYEKNIELLLSTQDIAPIKSFLQAGLLPEYQDELFQATHNPHAKEEIFLNYHLIRGLFQYGWTLEILENYYNNYHNQLKKDLSRVNTLPSIRELREKNKKHLAMLSEQAKYFNPLSNKTTVEADLKNTITHKISSLIVFYNDAMLKKHRACLSESNPVKALKYSNARTNFSPLEFSQMSHRIFIDYALTINSSGSH